ncbi:MAG: toprim domain-containing protein [Pararhizobium sp.]
MTLDQAIEQACRDVGIHPPKKTVFGKWLNTDTWAGKKGKGDGRVIVQEHFVTAWNWQTGEKSTVGLRDGLSAREQRAVAQSVARSKAKSEKDAARAAGMAEALISAATLSTHSYLAAKGFRDEQAMTVPAKTVRDVVGDYIVPSGARQAVMIPARRAGKVTSAQLIWEDGTKKFLFGGEIGGTCHRIASGAYTWLCEGYATGLSLRVALKGLRMQSTILCCFSASNIVAVAKQVRGRAFVAADNDRPPKHNPHQFEGLGAGEYYARQTDLPYGLPPDVGTDFNDMHQRHGIFAVQRVLTSTMSGRRAA